MHSTVRRLLAPWHNEELSLEQERAQEEGKRRKVVVMTEADMVASRAETVARMFKQVYPISV